MPSKIPFIAFNITLIALAACGPRVSSPTMPRAQPAVAVATVTAAQDAPAGHADSPEKAYQAYFDAMRNNEFDRAVRWISNYSLYAEGWTRESLSNDLKGGWFGALRFQELQVLDVHLTNPTTAIIHDRITMQQGRLTTPTIREQWNSARFEDGGWLVNAGDLVDAARVDVPAETLDGVTVRLTGINRYTTKTQLVFSIENTNRQVAWWGGSAAPALTLYAENRTIDAPGSALRFEAQQLYPKITVDANQFLAAYPTRVELRGWSLESGSSPGTPDPRARSWSYSFSVPELAAQ